MVRIAWRSALRFAAVLPQNFAINRNPKSQRNWRCGGCNPCHRFCSSCAHLFVLYLLVLNFVLPFDLFTSIGLKLYVSLPVWPVAIATSVTGDAAIWRNEIC